MSLTSSPGLRLGGAYSRGRGLRIRRHRLLVLASPLVVLAVGSVAARLFSSVLGRWAWTGAMLVYWAILMGLVWTFAGRGRLIAWFAASRGNRLWLVLAVGAGLLSFPFLLLPNIGLLASIPLAVLWLVFAPVNGACEELYWRGLLLDQTSGMSRWIIVAYASVAFVANHPLMLGVFAGAMAVNLAAPGRFIPFAAIVFFQGLVWSVLFLRTGSLRLSIASHTLTDLGTLSIFAFMNMVPVP
ncbi:MAG TPA: CPBP family intramembrane glutamic endopeptidase [Candidatus Dormibacteraeota bacterium]